MNRGTLPFTLPSNPSRVIEMPHRFKTVEPSEEEAEIRAHIASLDSNNSGDAAALQALRDIMQHDAGSLSPEVLELMRDERDASGHHSGVRTRRPGLPWMGTTALTGRQPSSPQTDQ